MAKISTDSAYVGGITVDGLDQTMELLKKYAPEVRALLARQIKQTADVVAKGAAGRINSRTGDTAAGYKVRRRGGTVQIVNDTVGGAIIEFAGAKNPRGKSLQGQHLIESLDETYGKPGRALWATYDETKGWLFDTVGDLVAGADRDLQSAMDKVR